MRLGFRNVGLPPPMDRSISDALLSGPQTGNGSVKATRHSRLLPGTVPTLRSRHRQRDCFSCPQLSTLSWCAARRFDHALVAAVPTAARWRLATLPSYLSQAELNKLMTLAFPPAGPQRQRDYAILRCLVDLGLRSCEVAALRLDDINWTNGTIAIPAGKSNRTDLLPLPAITGQALADYLRQGRPETNCRAVFVRHRAPLDAPVDTCVIRSVVRQAAARSGLADRLHGPHQLRHSAATRMLEAGATLKEIADVLRHRSLDTTAIYAKVDQRRLNTIAQPWPGGAQ
jgi:integrase/recombinase XerD